MRIAQMNNPSVQTVGSAKKGKTEQLTDTIPFAEVLSKSNEMRCQTEIDANPESQDDLVKEAVQQIKAESEQSENEEVAKTESDTKEDDSKANIFIDGQALQLMQDTGFVIKNEFTAVTTDTNEVATVGVEDVTSAADLKQSDVPLVQSAPQQATQVDMLQGIEFERVSADESIEFTLTTATEQTGENVSTQLTDGIQQPQLQQADVRNIEQPAGTQTVELTPQMEADIEKIEVNTQPTTTTESQANAAVTQDTLSSAVSQGGSIVGEAIQADVPIVDTQNRQFVAQTNEQQTTTVTTNENTVIQPQTVSDNSNTQQGGTTNNGESFSAGSQTAEQRDNRLNEVDTSSVASRIAFSGVFSGKESLITTTQIDTQQVVNQVTANINQMVAQQTESMTIELSPESLGKITIELSLEQGKLTIDVKADSVATSNLLAEHIDEVRKSISVNSTTVVEVNVQNEVDINTSSNNPFSDFASANQGESDKSSGHDAHGANTVTTAIKQEADQGETIRMIDNHLINYLV